MENTNDKVIIVAEITTNHLGDLAHLKEMVRLSKEAGADFVKLQRRHVETFYPGHQLDETYISPFGNTYRDFRHGIELSIDDIHVLSEECERVGIGWFFSILDHHSFEELRQLNMQLLKIPSTISAHTDFHKKVATNHKGPIVVSTGCTTAEYEEYIQETFKENEKIYLLQCTSSYPTLPDDCGISVVRHYHILSKKNPKIIPGYSSHDEGSLGCMLAVAAGAKMIEKHVKLGHTDWMHFQDVALDLANGEFARFVQDVRQAEKMCGDEKKEIKTRENHKYNYIPKLN